MRILGLIVKIIVFIFFISLSFTQNNFNPNPTKRQLFERYEMLNNEIKTDYIFSNKSFFQLTFNQSIYYNSNHPNFENHNGLYLPKGSGSISSLLLQYKGKHFIISVEPSIIDFRKYSVSLPEKKFHFSVLNDVSLENVNKQSVNNFRNMGLIFNYFSLSIGYGNWDQWWGPGIHNSLVMSNNAQGMPHFFVETLGYRTLFNDLQFKFKYTVSDAMLNDIGAKYFLSAYYLNLRYRNIELGSSQHILNGGYHDIPWSLNDALGVLFTQNNMKYWDEIIDYYITVTFPSSRLKIFYEFGFPNRSYNGQNPEVFRDHAMGSNLGLRKYGAFGSDEILFGFEYTRLLQGYYYNILPTPNWYDNIKYNYSSFNGRRWASHSGSDSDDFLIFIGYMNDSASIVYGLNYERHGVTYHFPPEVKLESRISASLKYKNTWIYINYENEYFEHYGFLDVNKNVWLETFEPGSLQRTHTLLLSIEHTFSF